MADIRSSQPEVARSFDLHSQIGVAQLLVAVRVSALTSEEKNELRDLVFQFSNSDDDAALRSLLERKIAEYTLEPPLPPASPEPEPIPAPPVRVLPFGSVRPRPAFAAPQPAVTVSEPEHSSNTGTVSVATEEQGAATPELTSDEKRIDVSAAVVPETNVDDEPVSIFTPHISTDPVIQAPPPPPDDLPEIVQGEPDIAITPLTQTTPPEASVPVQVEEPVAGDPVEITRVAQSESQSTVSPTLGSPDLTEKNLNRIREIKALVNEKVGNPVNLVDIDNAVGREYMSALLDAMKKINGGSAGVAAMDRLEAAYQAVTEVIGRQVPVKPSRTPVAEPATMVPPISVTPPMTTTAPAIDESPVSKNTADTTVVPPPPPHPSMKPVSVPASEESPAAISPTKAPAVAIPVIQATKPSPHEIASNTPNASTTVAPITKTAPRPLTPLDLPDPTSLENASIKGDPLFTREVDDGLNQLLSEWSLFKKSGLFGTGPKGMEHPLFKKISSLQIPLLLAGRFEGATQEIKQSITDYMNGWRYEQGIIYEQGETFEHYLRRVIKHIIDLQKKRTTA